MKYIGLLAITLLIVPSIASAQGAPPMPPPNGSGPADGMQSSREQMMQLRQETRSQILGALSAQHRSLLASVVGQLATSTSPDIRAAAQQLDAALSPQESQAILAAEAAMRSQMSGAMQNGGPPRNGAGPTDAGLVLLRSALAVTGPGPARPPGAQ